MEEIANQLSQLTSQIPNLQNQNLNNSQMSPQFPSPIMNPYFAIITSDTTEFFSTQPLTKF